MTGEPNEGNAKEKSEEAMLDLRHIGVPELIVIFPVMLFLLARFIVSRPK